MCSKEQEFYEKSDTLRVVGSKRLCSRPCVVIQDGNGLYCFLLLTGASELAGSGMYAYDLSNKLRPAVASLSLPEAEDSHYGSTDLATHAPWLEVRVND